MQVYLIKRITTQYDKEPFRFVAIRMEFEVYKEIVKSI